MRLLQDGGGLCSEACPAFEGHSAKQTKLKLTLKNARGLGGAGSKAVGQPAGAAGRYSELNRVRIRLYVNLAAAGSEDPEML